MDGGQVLFEGWFLELLAKTLEIRCDAQWLDFDVSPIFLMVASCEKPSCSPVLTR
jgi:hypothetical protein